MPAKSGVSGCIIAVIPGQIGICVYSPPIDSQGNSVRGIAVCQEISDEFELHAFNNRTNVRSVIRRDYRADLVRSNRLRTPEERKILAKRAARSPWSKRKGLVLRLDRTAAAPAHPARLGSALRHRRFQAGASRRHRGAQADPARGACHGGRSDRADIRSDGRGRAARRLAQEFSERENEHLVRTFHDADAALEWCEDQLLDSAPAVWEHQIRPDRNQSVQRSETGGVPPGRMHRPAADVREGRRHHPRGRRRQSVLRAGPRRGQCSDQGAGPRRPPQTGGLDRPGFELRRNGAARRRQTVGRHRRRRAGDLLWAHESNNCTSWPPSTQTS